MATYSLKRHDNHDALIVHVSVKLPHPKSNTKRTMLLLVLFRQIFLCPGFFVLLMVSVVYII